MLDLLFCRGTTATLAALRGVRDQRSLLVNCITPWVGFLTSTPSMLMVLNQEDLTKETAQQKPAGKLRGNIPIGAARWRFTVEETLRTQRSAGLRHDVSRLVATERPDKRAGLKQFQTRPSEFWTMVFAGQAECYDRIKPVLAEGVVPCIPAGNSIGQVASGIAGTLATSSVLGANDRIRVGLIGAGDRGLQLVREGGGLPQHRNRRVRRCLYPASGRGEESRPCG